jgi:hypothetical protein
MQCDLVPKSHKKYQLSILSLFGCCWHSFHSSIHPSIHPSIRPPTQIKRCFPQPTYEVIFIPSSILRFAAVDPAACISRNEIEVLLYFRKSESVVSACLGILFSCLDILKSLGDGYLRANAVEEIAHQPFAHHWSQSLNRVRHMKQINDSNEIVVSRESSRSD